MTTKRINHMELENGMKVWVEGHLFEVTGKRFCDFGKDKAVVRYEGKCVDKNDDVYSTGYNGGTYGANVDHPCSVEI